MSKPGAPGAGGRVGLLEARVTVTTIDPSTGVSLATYDEASPETVDTILRGAREASASWRLKSPAQRARALARRARSLRERRDELALMATREMGKPLADGRAEVDKCAWACDWFAEHGPTMLEPEAVATEALGTKVIYVPLGVLFAIMPWNFPYWQVVRALAPALAAGNVVVLKHAPCTTGCALLLADVADQAGLPSGVFSVLIAGAEGTPQLSERVITDDRVAAVTITGSTGAGRAVAAIAGRGLKKTVLELGGSDPFIVLADADLEAAAAWAVRSRFQNPGQSCIATKRIFVERPIARAFTERLLAHVARLRIGDPTEPGVSVGPLARRDLRDALARQVRESVEQGAHLLVGGAHPIGPASTTSRQSRPRLARDAGADRRGVRSGGANRSRRGRRRRDPAGEPFALRAGEQHLDLGSGPGRGAGAAATRGSYGDQRDYHFGPATPIRWGEGLWVRS